MSDMVKELREHIVGYLMDKGKTPKRLDVTEEEYYQLAKECEPYTPSERLTSKMRYGESKYFMGIPLHIRPNAREVRRIERV